MAPIILIIIFGILGGIYRGSLGLLAGAALGWLTSMALGAIFTLISGGFLPRKARRDTALAFMRKNRQIVELCTAGFTDAKAQKFVESQIERIFKKSSLNAPLTSETMGLSKQEILIATNEIISIESDANLRILLKKLGSHIVGTMY